MNLDLSGKNALVCGSSKGIGKAVALLFAESGANVTLLARDENSLKNSVKELSCGNGQVHDYIAVDMNDTAKLQSLVLEKINIKDGYHILVNNTGGPDPGLLHETNPDTLASAFNQHVLSAQLLTKILAQSMKLVKFGRIINIISVGLKQPIENLGVSNTIRGALGSWAKTLSGELGPYGITVNNILPGYTRTERLNHLFDYRSKIENRTADEIINSIVQHVPVKRLAEPIEIAYAALFLASDFASYINGINLPVDGGFLKTL